VALHFDSYLITPCQCIHPHAFLSAATEARH
jgi:hypothetical protein